MYYNTYNSHMRFAWDEEKREINIRNHGFYFADARHVFEESFSPLKTIALITEKNASSPGLLKNTVVVIAHTKKATKSRHSMRKATRNEQKIYFEGFTD